MSGFSFCFRLAQAVLAREEPEETFLKSVPQQLASLHIIHPVRVRSPCQVSISGFSIQAIWLHEPPTTAASSEQIILLINLIKGQTSDGVERQFGYVDP